MKILKSPITWIVGGLAGIWALSKAFGPKMSTSAVNPATGENVPPRTTNSGSKDEKTNFSGPRAVVKDNTFTCPKGYVWSNAERKCVAGGFNGFNGQGQINGFASSQETNDLEMLNAIGKTGQKRFDPGFDGNLDTEADRELLNMSGPISKLFNLTPPPSKDILARLKPGTKGVIRGEICDWDGANWVNCKKMGSATARMKPGTKAVVRNEVCEWNGSNWVNCKKLGGHTANA